MPRYFFNLAGAVSDPDDRGHELSSISDARIAAAMAAGEYLRDRPEVVWMGEEFRMEVTDERGLILFTVITLGIDSPAAVGKK